ncbi:MAG: carbonate dehydratase [Saprospiraceae bacterium]|nr:carbonate dehydratase [Saprospiraceae bacterium]
MSEFYRKLVQNNKDWVASKLAENPEYFKDMTNGQSPPVFWIGCSDSRVPANEITGTNAGDMFVHRNIANMVIHTDMNLLSVLDYAVNVLKVSHIIVCGHYGCGGIKTAMSNSQVGIIDNWVRHIKDVYRFHESELDAITDETQRFNRFVELNVFEQVFDLAKTSIVQNAWNKGQYLWIHGWVYSLETGLVKDLDITFKDNSSLGIVHRLNI